jgi:hypothetical protein
VALNDRALNGMADWLAGVATYLALHSADPGEAGANETTATRVAAAWSPASSGRLQLPGRTFTGGTPNGPVTHLGLWSAPTGGLFYGSGELDGDQAFNPNGSYNLDALSVGPPA